MFQIFAVLFGLFLGQHNRFEHKLASVGFISLFIFFGGDIGIIGKAIGDIIFILINLIAVLFHQELPAGHQVIGVTGSKLFAV